MGAHASCQSDDHFTRRSTRVRPAHLAAMAALLALAACKASSGGHGNDPCAGVTCSGHGTCSATDGAAACSCGAGYHAAGFSCVKDASSTWSTGVTVHLTRRSAGATTVSFGLPVPDGLLASAADLKVTIAGTPVPVKAGVLLPRYDAQGRATGIFSVLVQLPASALGGADEQDLLVSWTGGSASGTGLLPFADPGVTALSDEVIPLATRTIQQSGGVARLVETGTTDRVWFSSRLPRVMATFPAGYLADSGLMGLQTSSTGVTAGGTPALSFFAENLANFARTATFTSPYRLNPDSVADITSADGYEAWLYDRCATLLLAHMYTDDIALLEHAYRNCAHYAEAIGPDGMFTGKPEKDSKYSHLRGLFAYYALTGDEAARTAGRKIARMWLEEESFVAPYREGHLRGDSRLWTERLLGTSMEGLLHGFRLTGEQAFLTAFEELLATAYSHVTGDAAALKVINSWNDFPPQNCFIHNAAQHSEGSVDEPWCSGWMNELIVDPLLAYQELTQDPRVDEIFVRLARFMRDTGSSYFRGDPIPASTFLSPTICYDPADTDDPRWLVPLYGSGIDAAGVRRNFGEWSDFEHCAETTSITAAALRALVRQNRYDLHPIGPFASEGASLLALHHEFAFCGAGNFEDQSRPRRDPRTWTSAELAAGLADPAAFIAANKIGWPLHNLGPWRKFSWWFNQTMFQYRLLEEAGVTIATLKPGAVQPPGNCP